MKKTCPYCGNNPVPHFIYWQQESLNILLTPVRQKLLYNKAVDTLRGKGFGQSLVRGLVDTALALNIIKLQTEKDKCKVRRAQVLWEEADTRGIKMSELLLFGKPFDTYQASKVIEEGGKKINKRLIFSGLPRPDPGNRMLDLMDDKWLFKQIMRKHGLPVPTGQSCSSFFSAKKIFVEIQKQGHPVIVKPRSGSRGRHTTTFVKNIDELKLAFKIAKQLCYWVIVEQQLMGPVYRATVVNYELLGVLRGDPPEISGDGQHTVKELIDIKNRNKPYGVKGIQADEKTVNFLARQDLDLTTIPKQHQVVTLSEKIGVSYGGSSSEDLEICHEDNKQLFVKAALALEDPLLGFDFIIQDITRSYKEQQAGFIEVNSLPFINLHHDPLLGKPKNIAKRVWDMMGM